MGKKRFTRVEDFYILETLGVGSFAKVRLAVHCTTLKHYACKVIDKSFARERLQKRQISNEINAMICLNHPNIVRFVDVINTSKKIYILMEFVSGGELFNEITKNARLTEPEARFFFAQLVDGLRYCHTKGVYHRDLKPENILVNHDGVLKISDFGLSPLLAATQGTTDSVNSSLMLHTQCGSPNYVAPEIVALSEEGYSGAKVDAWSCGVILYTLTAGKLPFEAPEFSILLRLILRGVMSYPPHMSSELEDLLRHLLDINPDTRYTLAETRDHPWFDGPQLNKLLENPEKPERGLPQIVADTLGHVPKRKRRWPKEGNSSSINAQAENRSDSEDELMESQDSLNIGRRADSFEGSVPAELLPMASRYSDAPDAEEETDNISAEPSDAVYSFIDEDTQHFQNESTDAFLADHYLPHIHEEYGTYAPYEYNMNQEVGLPELVVQPRQLVNSVESLSAYHDKTVNVEGSYVGLTSEVLNEGIIQDHQESNPGYFDYSISHSPNVSPHDSHVQEYSGTLVPEDISIKRESQKLHRIYSLGDISSVFVAKPSQLKRARSTVTMKLETSALNHYNEFGTLPPEQKRNMVRRDLWNMSMMQWKSECFPVNQQNQVLYANKARHCDIHGDSSHSKINESVHIRFNYQTESDKRSAQIRNRRQSPDGQKISRNENQEDICSRNHVQHQESTIKSIDSSGVQFPTTEGKQSALKVARAGKQHYEMMGTEEKADALWTDIDCEVRKYGHTEIVEKKRYYPPNDFQLIVDEVEFGMSEEKLASLWKKEAIWGFVQNLADAPNLSVPGRLSVPSKEKGSGSSEIGLPSEATSQPQFGPSTCSENYRFDNDHEASYLIPTNDSHSSGVPHVSEGLTADAKACATQPSRTSSRRIHPKDDDGRTKSSKRSVGSSYNASFSNAARSMASSNMSLDIESSLRPEKERLSTQHMSRTSTSRGVLDSLSRCSPRSNQAVERMLSGTSVDIATLDLLSETGAGNHKFREVGEVGSASHSRSEVSSKTADTSGMGYSSPIGINPFAFDSIPGPTAPLPLANPFVSLLPDGMTYKKLLAKCKLRFKKDRRLQFHTLHEPAVCRSILELVLRDHGCADVSCKTLSAEKFRVQCTIMDGGNNGTAVMTIFRVDDGLCGVKFTGNRAAGPSRLQKFYKEITKLFNDKSDDKLTSSAIETECGKLQRSAERPGAEELANVRSNAPSDSISRTIDASVLQSSAVLDIPMKASAQ